MSARHSEPFGPYILARKIAVGGTAEIWLARREGQEGFARHIAIKRILPHLAGETAFVQLLLDEARLAAHLHHGHIVQIHDVGQIDGQAYIAMEYLPGTDVGRIVRRALKRVRRVVVAVPDDTLRVEIVNALGALPRRLEVVSAVDAEAVERRSAEGAVDLAIVDPALADTIDALYAGHPELLRAITLGEIHLRPSTGVLRADDLEPAAVAALADGCLRAPLPLDLAVQIVRAVADGLEHAHTAVDYADQPLQIVHRDVNPSNVLVSTSGTVKLVDFGIARAASSPEGRRRGFVGTYHYMSPEQTEGERLDARTDLFSLGTLIHELVTGEHPFRGDDMFTTMRAVREDTPPRLDARVPGVPPALIEIVERAGQKDADARYPSADAMLDDIEQLARRAGLNMSPKRLAGFVRVIFGQDVKKFGVTTMSLPAIRIDEDGNAVPAALTTRDSIRTLSPDALARAATAAVEPDADAAPAEDAPADAAPPADAGDELPGDEEDGPTQVAPPPPEVLAAIAAYAPPAREPPRRPSAPPAPVAPADHIARRLGPEPVAPRRRSTASVPIDRSSISAAPPPPDTRLPRGDGAVRALLVIALLALIALVGLYIWWRQGTTDGRSALEPPPPVTRTA